MSRITTFTHSALGKAIGVAILGLLLLIPAAFIQNVIQEREQRLQEVQDEISQKYGYPQVIAGPVLVVPYIEVTIDAEKKTRQEITKYAHFLPDTLTITGQVAPETRSRGIFDAVVYTGDITLAGALKPDIPSLGIDPKAYQWSAARLVVDITDGRGIRENVSFDINGVPSIATPTSAVFSLATSASDTPYETGWSSISYDQKPTQDSARGLAVGAPLPGYTGGAIQFSTAFGFTGSSQLDIVPLGTETSIHLTGAWEKPSFIGDLLPVTQTVADGAFAADWQVSQYGRGVPQAWTQHPDTSPNAVFRGLLSPVDFYAKTERIAKYALLFIGLTFVSFFLIEVMQRLRVHPLQYLLVGFALALFFLLLLALSEHIGFDTAYAAAASSVILLITLYAGSILKNMRSALSIGGVLAVLYIYLYLLLLLEEKSLLFGAIGLFLILAGIMYITRRVDWYTISEE